MCQEDLVAVKQQLGVRRAVQTSEMVAGVKWRGREGLFTYLQDERHQEIDCSEADDSDDEHSTVDVAHLQQEERRHVTSTRAKASDVKRVNTVMLKHAHAFVFIQFQEIMRRCCANKLSCGECLLRIGQPPPNKGAHSWLYIKGPYTRSRELRKQTFRAAKYVYPKEIHAKQFLRWDNFYKD